MFANKPLPNLGQEARFFRFDEQRISTDLSRVESRICCQSDHKLVPALLIVLQVFIECQETIPKVTHCPNFGSIFIPKPHAEAAFDELKGLDLISVTP